MGAAPTSALNEAIVMLRILRCIPTNCEVTSTQIMEQLRLYDASLSTRSLQRYLKALSEDPIFGVKCNKKGKPFGYRRTIGSGRFMTTPLSTMESLMIRLAEEALHNKIPRPMQEALRPLYEEASSHLGEDSPAITKTKAQKWLSKVASAPITLPRKAPEVKPGIFDTITRCLFDEHLISVEYRKRLGLLYRGKLCPLGLVHQDNRMYLVALPEDSDEIRHYALHRFIRARELKAPAPIPHDFELKDYLESINFNFQSNEKILLRLVFNNPIFYNELSEVPISDQAWHYVFKSPDVTQYVVDSVVLDSPLLKSFLAQWMDDDTQLMVLSMPAKDIDWEQYEKEAEAHPTYPPKLEGLKIKAIWGNQHIEE